MLSSSLDTQTILYICRGIAEYLTADTLKNYQKVCKHDLINKSVFKYGLD